MRLMGIPTRVRDDPNANAKRQRGRPSRSFTYVDIPPIVDNYPDDSQKGVATSMGHTNYGHVNKPHKEHLIMPEDKRRLSFYTLSEYFRKNLGMYKGIARREGVAEDDIGDVVDDAIATFLENTSTNTNTRLTLDQIERIVKPQMLDYLEVFIMIYSIERGFIPPYEPEVKKPEVDLDKPAHYLLLHMISEDPNRALDVENESLYESRDPWSADFRIEDNKSAVLGWLEDEIDEAITEVDISLPDLLRRYSFKENPNKFVSLAQEQGNLDEQKIADYVAFGTWELDRDELLQNPLFYEALHSVLKDKGVEVLVSYPPKIELAQFAPMRQRK